jgi:hypothetical protein
VGRDRSFESSTDSDYMPRMSPLKLSPQASKKKQAVSRKSVALSGGGFGLDESSRKVRSTRGGAEEQEAAQILAKIDRGIAVEEAMTAKLLERYGL